MSYRGRFAPSPTGPLHLGSLVCALASYLDARQHSGVWLVRMEDIDPPREEHGAAQRILNTLQKHGLFWDESVLFQSTRVKAYQQQLTSLAGNGLIYNCSCSRKRLAKLDSAYDRHCLEKPPENKVDSAQRLNLSATCAAQTIIFPDRVKRLQSEDLRHSCGDFIIHRKGGLYAYQLAVVTDDIDQHITHIVRGDDLLDCTARQIFLTTVLEGAIPTYAHIPVVVGADGHKLSKQSFAPALDDSKAQINLIEALNRLKVTTPNGLEKNTVNDILEFGLNHFNMNRLKSH